jgi:hypothetical protein
MYLEQAKMLDASEFMEKMSWRLFCIPENRGWTGELLKQAYNKYEEHKDLDCTYTRPNFKYQQ